MSCPEPTGEGCSELMLLHFHINSTIHALAEFCGCKTNPRRNPKLLYLTLGEGSSQGPPEDQFAKVSLINPKDNRVPSLTSTPVTSLEGKIWCLKPSRACQPISLHHVWSSRFFSSTEIVSPLKHWWKPKRDLHYFLGRKKNLPCLKSRKQPQDLNTQPVQLAQISPLPEVPQDLGTAVNSLKMGMSLSWSLSRHINLGLDVAKPVLSSLLFPIFISSLYSSQCLVQISWSSSVPHIQLQFPSHAFIYSHLPLPKFWEKHQKNGVYLY